MLSLGRNFGKNDKIYPSFNHLVRLFCVKTHTAKEDVDFKSNFSAQENSKILEILNASSPEELSKYNIPLARIQMLANWKSRKGSFKNINDVLKVEGFGESILREISESITYHSDAEQIQTTKLKTPKRIKHLVVPDIGFDVLSSLHSAVAIHVEPTGIGWARLDKQDNSLTSWTFEDFSMLPQKVMPTDTFNLALNLLKKTPPGDVYIFETLNGLSLQAQGQQAKVSTHNQKIALISMLLALINTSVNHNLSLQRLGSKEPLREIVNRAFFLKSNISARLFGTLIGSERVSSVTSINRLLKYDFGSLDELPYTPVIFKNPLKQAFLTQSPTNKELMAQALMLGVSFMDLHVRRKSESYEVLNLKKK